MIVSTPRIKLDKKSLSDGLVDRLVGLDVLLSIRRPGTATMRFQDPDYKLLDDKEFAKFKIGMAVSVSLAKDGTASTVEVFEGEVISIGVEQSVGGRDSVVTVEAADGSHRLAAAAHPTTWLDTTTKAVVSEVAKRHGLKATIVGSGAAFAHPYLAQAGTDHELLDALARQIGFVWWTHGKELHFSERPEPKKGTSLKRGEDLLSVAIRYDGRDTPKTVKVTGWDTGTTKSVVSTAKKKAAGASLGSTATFVSTQHDAALKAFGRTLSIGELPVDSEKTASTVAEAVQGELQQDGLRVEATLLGTPSVRAGEWVRLEELGKTLSGDYFVTEVRHRFGPGQDLLTELVGDASNAAQSTWRPRMTVPGAGSWTTRGPVPALVTNVKDPEKLGRVKVKFPSLDDTIESTWARVVSPGAGKGRGLDLRPRVNDEVLVAFAHGDHGRPYVLGGLWSKQNLHPGDAAMKDADQLRDSIRSDDGGHVTLHHDGDTGSEGPKTWKGAKLKGAVSLMGDGKAAVLAADQAVVSTDGKDITITNGKATIKLLENGNVSIECEALEVKAKKDVKLAAQSGKAAIEAPNLEFKGKAGAKIEAPTTEVKSMAGIKLKSTKVEVGP